MGDNPQDVIAAQQTRENKTELCISRNSVTLSNEDEDIKQELVVSKHHQVEEERSQLCKIGVTSPVDEETKQVMITPQQKQTTESEDKSELSIGYIGVKLPTTTVPGISLVIKSLTGTSEDLLHQFCKEQLC